MTHFRITILCILAIFIMYVPHLTYGAGWSMNVQPLEVTAGSHQSMKFEFSVGDPGLESGGAVRMELPVAYLETAPYFWDRPQLDQPEVRGYVKAEVTTNANTQLKLYGASGGIIECTIKDRSLAQGEKIFIIYSGIVQSLTWNVPVRGQWKNSANDEWNDITESVTIKIHPQKAVTLHVVAPADVIQGSSFPLAVSALDKFGNRAEGYRGKLTFSSTDESASLPKPYTFTEKDSGVHVFEGVRYFDSGFHRIMVTDGELEAKGNHSSIRKSLPEYKKYFGDTHFHTGAGTGYKRFTMTRAGGEHRGQFITDAHAYSFARDVMRLDFASAAEHDSLTFDEKAWDANQDITDSFYNPGKFTTFHGYEWTASPTEGHHVVIYKERGCKVFKKHDYSTKSELFRALDRQNKPTIVIPHCMWTQPDHGIWEVVSNKYRRIGEIYSLWNNRFLLQPADDPQRFELGMNNQWSYQYAWHNGHKIGVIGSSDNHTGHPGANNYSVDMQHPSGLAVVLAKENTREAIWDALHKRRVYGTTGTRILLDFTSDGHQMGEEYTANHSPEFSVKVAGTNKIVAVELVKHDSTGYQTLVTKNPDAETCEFEYKDKDFKEDSFYYARARQVDEYWRGMWSYPTCEMAWTSPIWINYAK